MWSTVTPNRMQTQEAAVAPSGSEQRLWINLGVGSCLFGPRCGVAQTPDVKNKTDDYETSSGHK